MVKKIYAIDTTIEGTEKEAEFIAEILKNILKIRNVRNDGVVEIRVLQ